MVLSHLSGTASAWNMWRSYDAALKGRKSSGRGLLYGHLYNTYQKGAVYQVDMILDSVQLVPLGVMAELETAVHWDVKLYCSDLRRFDTTAVLELYCHMHAMFGSASSAQHAYVSSATMCNSCEDDWLHGANEEARQEAGP